MVYLKSVLIGIVAVLLGCVIWVFGLTLWFSFRIHGAPGTVSFSPMGLAQHTTHSIGFWAFLAVLFMAGFAPSTFLRKR